MFEPFERSVLTYDPLNPVEWQVERGNIGSDMVNFLNAGQASNNEFPAANKVFIIVLENADYSQAMAQPYLKKLAG